MPPIKMYTTAYCPYCIRAKQFLQSRGVAQIEEVRIDADAEARTQMMQSTGRRTVPQIFIGDTHVGGCDDLVDLDRRGGLMPLLGALNVTVSFYLAFSLALRAQNVSGVDRSRIYAAIRARLRKAPLSFFLPSRQAA
mgnify:CR=1 FL=1